MSITILAAFSQTPAAKIMPLGDSITRGTNDINYPNGDIPGGYRRNLGILLSNGGFAYDFVGSRSDNTVAGMDPHHNGINGIRTDEVLANLSTWLSAQPDTVLMMLGTNDILQGVPVATVAGNLGSLIDQITSGSPRRRLYVSTILPISGKDWYGQTAAQLNANANSYNTQVRSIVQQYRNNGRNVTLMDMSAQVVYTDSNPANNFFQPGDGVHPGQAGYDQMGSLWYQIITASGSLLDPAYEVWTANYPAFSALSPAQRLPLADPNNDGVTNLMAYGLGLDPLSNPHPDSMPGLVKEAGSGNLLFQFRRNKLATDVTHQILVSPDLSDGSWTVRDQTGATTSDVSGNGTVDQVSLPIPLETGSPQKFLRLRVTQSP